MNVKLPACRAGVAGHVPAKAQKSNTLIEQDVFEL
jgi:hypothetical protein